MSKQNSSKVRPSTRNTPAPRRFAGRSVFEAAYEKRLVEIESVGNDELARINLDVHAAVATVLGSLPEIARYRGEMSKLHGLDQDKIDGLEEYAQAAAEAHSRWITIVTRPEGIVALYTKGRAMRALLRSDARALAHRGLLSRARIAAFKGHVGYKNVAFDLIDWANLLRDHWGGIQGKTPLTEEDVRQAKALGEQMIRAVGLRSQAPALQAAAARIRHQALTLLIHAYHETRRALAYLRRNQGDVDRIAPSLYGGRTRKAEGEKPTLPSTPPEPTPLDAPVATGLLGERGHGRRRSASAGTRRSASAPMRRAGRDATRH